MSNPFIYVRADDAVGYKKIGVDMYYLEFRNGEMVIGDRLPKTELEAIEYCRVANLCYKMGRRDEKREIKEKLQYL